MDVTKLTDEQLRVAKLVAEAARRKGVDPNYALAVASVESRFDNSAVSPKGAIGVMQLMPDTAKSLKVDPRNLEQNIEGGMTYLKRQLDTFGNDRYLASIAYNAGPGVAIKVSESKTLKDVPNETLKYLNDINSLHTVIPSSVVKEEAQRGSAAPASSESGNIFDVDPSTLSPPIPKQPYGFSIGQDLIAAGYGGAAGAAVGAVPLVRDIALSTARQMGEAFRGQDPSAVQKWTEKMRSGEYRGGKTFKEAYMLGEGERTAPALRNPATGEKFQPTFKFAKPDLVNPSPLQQAKQVAQTVITNPVVAKTLGGLGAGFNISEAEQRARAGDIPGAVAAGAGALGSAATMFPPLAPLGTLLTGTSAGGLAVMDAVRNKLAKEAQYPQPEASPEELAAAAAPAFVTPRSGLQRRAMPALSGPPTENQQQTIINGLMTDLDAQMKYFSSR